MLKRALKDWRVCVAVLLLLAAVDPALAFRGAAIGGALGLLGLVALTVAKRQRRAAKVTSSTGS